MLTGSSSLPNKSMKTKADDRLSGRSSEEIQATNSSSEVYYGGASVAIPFTWESQPGTPKVKFREAPLPPLTPPPSFYSNHAREPIKKHSVSSLLHAVLPKLAMRKIPLPTSPASSSSSSVSSPRSWSHSVLSSLFGPTLHRQSRLSSPRSSFNSRFNQEDDEYGSPNSIFCFGISCGASTPSSRRCSSNISKVLLRVFS